MEKRLKIPISMWLRLNKTLRGASAGKRESGAFLLGKADTSKVSFYIPYHLFDPISLEEGYIHFKGEGYINLWEICRRKQLTVIGDVHTHPGSNTNQSQLDRMHPMIFQKSHMALIIPNYAKRKLPTLQGIGIFEYQGDFIWKKYDTHSQRIKLTLI